MCDNRVVNDRVMKLLHSLTPKFGTQLQILRLNGCKLSVTGLEALASTLTGPNDRTGDSVSYTALTELDLSHNNLVGAKPQTIFCGLSRLQGRATTKRLSVALANNHLGRPGTKPLSYHISLLADLLTDLDLSECEEEYYSRNGGVVIRTEHGDDISEKTITDGFKNREANLRKMYQKSTSVLTR
ncbi:hypothetical protein P879_01775 [Paragonimus westermani]|uniref:Uncharacterized protein n=1 Tax=Paragonimus westermani TaxID=34504 RepID=A0A8T0DSG6_9TREM|nr:hypothetical protein P879_01775 [Paragonimus westermani]